LKKWKYVTLSLIACFWALIHFVCLDFLIPLGRVSFGGIIGNGSIYLATQSHGTVGIPAGVNFSHYIYRDPPSNPFGPDPFSPKVTVPKLTETLLGHFSCQARSGPQFKFSITLPFWMIFVLITISLFVPEWNRAAQQAEDAKPNNAPS